MNLLEVYNDEDRAAFVKLKRAICMSGIFMIIELCAGYLACSLALMADAAHVLSDVSSFILSAYAIWMASKPGSESHTYGHGRAEVLVALVSILTIWAVSIGLLKEAFFRLWHEPHHINPKIIVATGMFGLISNVVLMFTLGGHSHSHGDDDGHDHGHDLEWKQIAPTWLGGSSKENINNEDADVYQAAAELSDTEKAIHSGLDHNHSHDDHSHFHGGGCRTKERNMNIQAAYLHALGDLIQNIGVVIAGICLLIFPKALWIDPMVTILFSLIVMYSTFGLFRNITNILLQKTPESLDLLALEHDLLNLTNVQSVHDVHAWSVRAGKPQFTCHIRTEAVNGEDTLINATRLLHDKYGILHTTIQIDNSVKSECNTKAHGACHVHSCEATCDGDEGQKKYF